MNRRCAFAAFLGLWATINTALGAVGVCDEPSLRAAIAGGGHITFDCDGTIVLSSPLVITQNVTLNATGHNVTISGNDQVRIFEVGYGFSLHLINLTISHGFVQGTNGGPSQTGGNAEGAAVWFSNLGAIRASDCRFINNRAVGGAGGEAISGRPGNGGYARGGAIFGSAAIYLTNCVFTANAAEGGPGGGPEPGGTPISGQPGDSHGGAILSLSGPLTVQNCTFTSNAAATTGGAINSWISPASFSNCVFVANAAGFGGGALFSQAGDPPLSVGNSVFTGNSATGQGGAIAAANLKLSQSYFVSNSVMGKPAALQPTPTPGGGAAGGALSLGAGEINDCTFQHNIARGGDGLASPSLNAGSGMGGAIHTAGDGRTTVRNSTFAHNIASSGIGQRLDAGAIGGALACVSGELRIQYSTIASNAAISFSNAAHGGGVAQFAGGAVALVYLHNSILSGNTTNGAFGGNVHPTFINADHNVSSDGTPISIFTANYYDPRVGALTDNGGPVPTMALMADSPAINAGRPADCPLTDARGVLRPQRGACDVGAFEQTFMRLEFQPGIEAIVSYFGVPNERYVVGYSFNLIDWQEADTPLLGGPMSWAFPATAGAVFFRVKLLP